MQKEEALQLTYQFLTKGANGNDIESLRAVLQFHETQYYIHSNNLISDFEYDTLFNLLKDIELQNPELISPTSPTQRVAVGIADGLNSVAHLVPMLSLENTYNAEDLLDWDRKVKEFTESNEVSYIVEPKFDGAGISIIYENDILVRAASRGDGSMGEDITNNAKQLKTLPLKAKFSKYNIKKIEIRGEVIIPVITFNKINAMRQEQGLAPFANPRNTVSGGLRMLDPKDAAQRGMEAFMYHISYVQDLQENDGLKTVITHQSKAMAMLQDLGVKNSSPYITICNSIQAVIECTQQWFEKRDQLPYEIDGLVIKINSLEQQEKCGYTAHHPRWAVAYKFPARQATAVLQHIEYQIGRTGAITPVAKITPVALSGVTISSISLFNEEVIKEKNLMIGDTVIIERSGDVIPYIVGPNVALRNGSEQMIVFPTTCPFCNAPLIKPESEAVWRCENINCDAQNVEKIIHFVSKDAMDIKGLGEANIRKLFKLGFLKTIPQLYNLDYEAIAKLDGFGTKTIQNLQDAIEASKHQSLDRCIFALGIRFVGTSTASTLANNITQIEDLKNLNFETLIQWPDIGEKVAQSIIQFCTNELNWALVTDLKAAGLVMKAHETMDKTGLKLYGKTFLFTGTLPTLTRSKAEAMAESMGASIAGSVNKKLDYLVVGTDAGSKLEKAQKITTIQIIDEATFIELLAEK